MSKTIKLEDKVYQELRSILWPQETFSHGVMRLLETRRALLGMGDIIEGAKGFNDARWERRDSMVVKTEAKPPGICRRCGGSTLYEYGVQTCLACGQAVEG